MAFLRFHDFDVRFKFLKKLAHSKKVLELGCGRGGNCIALKGIWPKIEIYGIDLLEKDEVPDFVNYIKSNLDTEPLPYPDEFLDAILMSHVIEHLNHPLQLGSEINRVMKGGAVIYVETPNWTTMFVPSFGFKRDQHNPFNFFDDPTHIKPWSKHGIFEFLFQGCGLHVRKVGTIRNWPRIPFDLLLILRGLIKGTRSDIVSGFWNLYGWCIYAIAVKK